MYPLLKLGEMHIPIYFLWNSIIISFIFLLSHRRARLGKLNLNANANHLMIAVIFAFFGARLGHVFFEAPSHYSQNWQRLFFIWQGGFVYLTGLIAGGLALFIWLKKSREAWRTWFDFYTPLLALGYGLARIGCFLTGCCFGVTCSLPWAVEFSGLEGARHPTQLYLTFIELSLFAVLIWAPKKFKLQPGEVFFGYIALSSLGRMWIETLRDDFRGTFILGLSPSSWISLIFLSLAVGFITFNRLRLKSTN